ncbi:MucR family transcriptional regulator [Nitrospirillum amazonense]|uniref:MucR family transcriptional regulator n=1 Tax=Nitrospirillum amazonense TaxID=28077 RepID=UPI0024127939|nr:MucR family transcriptional regulator [Nitrospirillum amazonense]MDG3444644.1 MucR family transcriptional regulator [Nitrospirillum amazonense]
MLNEKYREQAISLVVAHMQGTPTQPDQIVDLVKKVYSGLLAWEDEASRPPEPVPVAKPTPAVPIRKSVTPEYIICLEDGKRLKMLKRHLRTAYGMSPDDYRTKWGLPSDYPMVAPEYAEARSGLAKQIGLGRNRGGTKPSPAPTQPEKGARPRQKAAATA